MAERPFVGLVVNPSASRDIRRLTSLARTVDVHERVNQVARILQGVAAAAQLVPGGLGPVRYMPESCRVVERACAEIARGGLSWAPGAVARGPAGSTPGGGAPGATDGLPSVRAEALAVGASGVADDAAGTVRAASALRDAGAPCVVTVGGDGTNRAVAQGWLDAVVVAVPGGTNNAFSRPVDPVAAGLAAGLFAGDPVAFAEYAWPCPRLEVRVGPDVTSFALVDVAVVLGAWVGAHAVWDAATLLEAVVTRADPAVSGLAGLAGMVRPLAVDGTGAVPRAVHLEFDPAAVSAARGVAAGASRDLAAGTTRGPAGAAVVEVLAPLGPGHLERVAVRATTILDAGQMAVLGPYPEPVTLAFDGERETVVPSGVRIEVRLARSPLRLLDAVGLLRRVAAAGGLRLPSRG